MQKKMTFQIGHFAKTFEANVTLVWPTYLCDLRSPGVGKDFLQNSHLWGFSSSHSVIINPWQLCSLSKPHYDDKNCICITRPKDGHPL